MARRDPVKSSVVVGWLWFVVSAAAAYPLYQMLVGWGFNSGLAVVAVFLGCAFLYNIPYRMRVKEENEAALEKASQWRG